MKATALTLVALGAIALTGCDFAGSTDFQAVPLADVQINNLPLDGFDEDGSLAEPFVEIQNAAGRTIWRSEQLTPEQLAAPIAIPAGAVQVAASTVGVVVAVFDYDSSLTDSDLMARSVDFSIDRLQAEPTMELATGRTGTTVTVRSAAAAQQ